MDAPRKRKRENWRERCAILRSWRLCGVGLSTGWASPDHLGLAYDWAAPLWRRACAASLTAARHTSVPGVSHNLHCASLGEPTPGVRRRSPTLLWRHRYSATASTSLSIKKRRVGWVEAAGALPAVAVLKMTPVYTSNAEDCTSSSGLTHLSSLRSNLKPSLLHVSRYLLNCLWSIGAVLFT